MVRQMWWEHPYQDSPDGDGGCQNGTHVYGQAPLHPTGILDPKGRAIYRRQPIGFGRLEELVVLRDLPPGPD